MLSFGNQLLPDDEVAAPPDDEAAAQARRDAEVWFGSAGEDRPIYQKAVVTSYEGLRRFVVGQVGSCLASTTYCRTLQLLSSADALALENLPKEQLACLRTKSAEAEHDAMIFDAVDAHLSPMPDEFRFCTLGEGGAACQGSIAKHFLRCVVPGLRLLAEACWVNDTVHCMVITQKEKPNAGYAAAMKRILSAYNQHAVLDKSAVEQAASRAGGCKVAARILALAGDGFLSTTATKVADHMAVPLGKLKAFCQTAAGKDTTPVALKLILDSENPEEQKEAILAATQSKASKQLFGAWLKFEPD